MRKWFVMLCLLAVALLPAACAPAGGQEPAAVVAPTDGGEPTIDAPALNPVPLPGEADPEVAAADDSAVADDSAGDTLPEQQAQSHQWGMPLALNSIAAINEPPAPPTLTNPLA